MAINRVLRGPWIGWALHAPTAPCISLTADLGPRACLQASRPLAGFPPVQTPFVASPQLASSCAGATQLTVAKRRRWCPPPCQGPRVRGRRWAWASGLAARCKPTAPPPASALVTPTAGSWAMAIWSTRQAHPSRQSPGGSPSSSSAWAPSTRAASPTQAASSAGATTFLGSSVSSFPQTTPPPRLR